MTKKEILQQIKSLIDSTGNIIEINPKYLEYFNENELLEIKEQLESKKENKTNYNNIIDDIFQKCS